MMKINKDGSRPIAMRDSFNIPIFEGDIKFM